MAIAYKAINKDEIPKATRGCKSNGNGTFGKIILSFAEDDIESAVIDADENGEPLTKDTSKRMYGNIRTNIDNLGLKDSIKAIKRGNNIYLVWIGANN